MIHGWAITDDCTGTPDKDGAISHFRLRAENTLCRVILYPLTKTTNGIYHVRIDDDVVGEIQVPDISKPSGGISVYCAWYPFLCIAEDVVMRVVCASGGEGNCFSVKIEF